jgi:hypothetical protein
MVSLGRSFLISLAVGLAVCLPFPVAARAVNDVAGTLITFNDNGAWSWFEDERAIVDTAAGKIIVSSVAAAAGSGGATRSGDVDVAELDLATGDVTRFVLSPALQADDHDSAALWRRPNGHYVASYSKHGSDQLTRWRISTNPGDISGWGPEQTRVNGAGTTYSNLHYLPNDNGGAGRLYNFTRSVGFDPNILFSDNHGETWSDDGRLLIEGGTGDRPYLRYFSDGQRIHLIATERHPRNFDNSIYHAYIENGQLFSSTGSPLDTNLFDATAVAPADLSPVFSTGTFFGGTEMRRAWTIDVAIDDAGNPHAVFQARANDLNTDHRFFYARFNGSTWTVNQLARAGGFLYSAEDDYTGLAALDPHDPNRLFISTKIDPRTNDSMQHYEIFEGVTTTGGASWTWSPITYNSTMDNLRPIVPAWDDEHTALLWMRGVYSTYTSYNLDIVGLTSIGDLEPNNIADIDSDHDVDVDDFLLLLAGIHTDLSGLSQEEAHEKGDLNGDMFSNFADYVIFRDAYNMEQGAGAFEDLIAKVPEPGSWGMIVLAVSAACLGADSRDGRRSNGQPIVLHRSTQSLEVQHQISPIVRRSTNAEQLVGGELC